MKEKTFLMLILVPLIIIIGCSFIVPRQVKESFKYCFNGEKTGLDTLININGYYAPSPDGVIVWNNRVLNKDTISLTFVFYDNGFIFRYFGAKNMSSHIRQERWGGDAGGYILCGDTIKLQYVNGPGIMTRGMIEIWFKIIDRNTLQRIETRDGTIHPASERIFTFRPLKEKMRPEVSWIYNKRWFRCR